MDKIRITESENGFAICLVQDGKPHEMDRRSTWADAEEFAFYLAARLKLDVFYRGQKVEPRGRR